jgi:hypothetical protein
MFLSEKESISRDPHSKALLNNDKQALLEHKAKKKQRAEMNRLLLKLQEQDKRLCDQETKISEMHDTITDLINQMREIRSGFE